MAMENLYIGDSTNAFGRHLMTIDINNPSYLQSHTIAKIEWRCGKILKTYKNPTFPITVDLTDEETRLLKEVNRCYLAAYEKYTDSTGATRYMKLTCKNGYEFRANARKV